MIFVSPTAEKFPVLQQHMCEWLECSQAGGQSNALNMEVFTRNIQRKVLSMKGVEATVVRKTPV